MLNVAKNDIEKIKILLIEDDEIVSFVESKYLYLLNCDVTIAQDSQQALTHLEVEESFDLIFLDLGLPKVSGFELCQLIRQKEQYKKIPIVALTGFGEIVKDLAFEAGVSDFLVKPASQIQLFDVLNIWLPETKRTLLKIPK